MESTTSTVLIRLDGPMQAWSRSHRSQGGGGRRPTNTHPTKTGVIGLIANALGRDRADDVSDLTRLLFAVRVDRAGTPDVDFHTVGGGDFPLLPGNLLDPDTCKAAAALPEGVTPTMGNTGGMYAAPRRTTRTKDGGLRASRSDRAVAPSHDAFLADAAFTVALTGPPDVITQVADALTAPARSVHLGRVAYPPVGELLVGVTNEQDPVRALTEAPLADRADHGPYPVHSETLPGQTVHDQPLHYGTRTATLRRDGRTTVPGPSVPPGGPTGNDINIPDMFTPPEETPR